MSRIVYLWVLFDYFQSAATFNYYVNPSDVLQQQSQYFGYTTVLQENRLLVGSPKASSDNLRDFNGSVFFCENFSNCNRLKGFDQRNNLLGASIDAGISKNSNAVICEPRYLETEGDSQFPVGRCFIYKNNGISEIIQPMKSLDYVRKNNDATEYYAGMAEAGFSVKRIKDQLLILGAPGFDNRKGYLVEYSNQNAKLIQIGDQPNNYGGYDLSYVKMSDGTLVWYVVGSPRANNLQGAVVVVQPSTPTFRNMKVFTSFKGEQFGEYFGGAVCSADLNGDGFDDIIVGSPTYRSDNYDEGKITVYFSHSNNGIYSIIFQEKIYGQVAGGRFGTAITKLGKLLPDDNVDSIAVSAPYENNGNGVVYIYKRDGRNLKLYQKILPSKTKKSLGFGISVTSSLDIDANQFSDFAVGAYQSSEIYLVKARPIITLMLYNVSTSIDKILIGKTQDFFINFCISFHSISTALKSVDNVNVNIAEEYRRVTIDKPTEIVEITDNGNSVPQCFRRNVIAKGYSVDDIRPVDVKISASLPYLDVNCSTCPMEHPTIKAMQTLTIPISPDCGPDDKCTPQYELTFPMKSFLVGASPTYTFDIDIRNIGEPAYVCELIVTLPEDVNIYRLNDCVQTTVAGENALKCLLGNPLKSNAMKSIQMLFDVSNLDATRKDLCFKTEVISYDNIGNYVDNFCVPLQYERELFIKGTSVPTKIDYDTEQEIKNFTHEFSITNKGPSPYKDLTVKFFVPFSVQKLDSSGVNQLLDIYDPMAVVDNVAKNHICSIVNDYRTLSSQAQPTKGPPRASRSVETPGPEYTISHKQVLENISSDDVVELGDVTSLQIVCSAETLLNSMVVKIPIRINMTNPQMYYGDQLESKNSIVLGTSCVIAADDKNYSGLALTILDYSSSGLKTWQYALIITFALIIGIAVLVAIIYGLYKMNFFSRPLKEKMDTMEMKLVDETKTGSTPENQASSEMEGTATVNIEKESYENKEVDST